MLAGGLVGEPLPDAGRGPVGLGLRVDGGLTQLADGAVDVVEPITQPSDQVDPPVVLVPDGGGAGVWLERFPKRSAQVAPPVVLVPDGGDDDLAAWHPVEPERHRRLPAI